MNIATLHDLDEQLRPFADWLGTYALHSTCALGVAWLIARLCQQRSLGLSDALLRQALWLPLVSATVQFLFVGNPWSVVVVESPMTVDEMPALLAALPASAPAAEPASIAPEPELPRALLAVACAAACAVVGLLWLWRTAWRLRRLLATRRPETDPRILSAAAQMATGLGLRHSPQISRAESLTTPIAFGFLRPEICLPARATTLDDASLRAMLGHELTHLRRCDPGWMWFGAWVNALFPWQLLLACVRRQWSRIVELRCDAEAAHHTSSTAVARCLIEVAEWLRPEPERPVAALGMAARPSALRERVEAALASTRPPETKRLATGGVAVFALTALTMAAPGFGDRTQALSTRARFVTALQDPSGHADSLLPFVAIVDREYADVVREANELQRALLAVPEQRSAVLLAALRRRLTTLEQLRARLLARVKQLTDHDR